MLQPEQVDDLLSVISTLTRPALIEQFRSFPSSFALDFTPEFLATQPLERLQHIFLAVCLTNQRMPELPGLIGA
jgi:hypothetical protein